MYKDGKQNGLAIDEHQDGNEPEGLYENGERSGLGKYTWASGSSYEGDHRDGNEHGPVIFRWSNGDPQGFKELSPENIDSSFVFVYVIFAIFFNDLVWR